MGWTWRGRDLPLSACIHTLRCVLIAALAAACSSARPVGPSTQVLEWRGKDALSSLMSKSDQERLSQLAAERAVAPATYGYQIGPDDLIEVRIQDLFEVTSGPVTMRRPAAAAAVADVGASPSFQQGLRVGANGEISIPQLGVVQAAGLTSQGLEQELKRRWVARGILHNPEVSVTIAEYRSAVVAVVGMVQRPGLYPLTRPGATISDLIWAAGGPNRDASRVVQFAPASAGNLDPSSRGSRLTAPYPQLAQNYPRTGAGDTLRDVSDTLPYPAAGTGVASVPIRIDLDALLQTSGQSASDLNPPVRPGDVISIGPAGTVLVGGWVLKPGSYSISRNLTLSGAVTAAGGDSFAADLHRASVRRVLSPGDERIYVVDLDAVAAGQEPDMPIIDGDVVYLPSDNVKLVPWALWAFVATILRFGASFPVV